MIDDIRVVMLIIAHCLSNSRHQGDIDVSGGVDKFFEITKYLIIPIVHRLGLYNIKKDLEEAEGKEQAAESVLRRDLFWVLVFVLPIILTSWSAQR